MTNREGDINKILNVSSTVDIQERPDLVNCKLVSDMTNPMCRAAYLGHRNVITLLLSKGGDIDLRSSDGRSPLMWASFRGNAKMMEYLIEMGSLLDSVDEAGNNAMDICVIMMNY